VVALNLGPFAIVAFNGLVVWGQLMNVQRDWRGGLLAKLHAVNLQELCSHFPLYPYMTKVACGIRSILWNKLKYFKDCNARLHCCALFIVPHYLLLRTIPPCRFVIGQYVTLHGDVISHVNISNVQVEDGGIYRCTASNRVGEASHSADMRVYGE